MYLPSTIYCFVYFQVLYLRKFSNLRTLNLSGNPFSEEANYKEYVIAHLPDLVYLDFRLVDESAREAATERYRYSIEELVHDETIAKRKQDEEEEKQKEQQLHKVVFKDTFYVWTLGTSLRLRLRQTAQICCLSKLKENWSLFSWFLVLSFSQLHVATVIKREKNKEYEILWPFVKHKAHLFHFDWNAVLNLSNLLCLDEMSFPFHHLSCTYKFSSISEASLLWHLLVWWLEYSLHQNSVI